VERGRTCWLLNILFGDYAGDEAAGYFEEGGVYGVVLDGVGDTAIITQSDEYDIIVVNVAHQGFAAQNILSHENCCFRG